MDPSGKIHCSKTLGISFFQNLILGWIFLVWKETKDGDTDCCQTNRDKANFVRCWTSQILTVFLLGKIELLLSISS